MDSLYALAEQLGQAMRQQRLMLVTAESCTGGWVGEVVTAVPGSSQWYDRGFITYSNAAKMAMLGVQPETLDRWGAVSEQTVREMAEGALSHSDANIALSVSGIAGPGGGSPNKPVGTVCFGWAVRSGPVWSQVRHFPGDRQMIRRQAVQASLLEVFGYLQQNPPA